jgi:glycosyltransferase involved in cell wall biosynthesis
MRIGIDISQAIFGTGVSDYTINLVRELTQLLSPEELILFGSSFRRADELKQLFPQTHTFRLPPSLLQLLWNKYHFLGIENFLGKLDVFHTSDWTQPPSNCPSVTTVHDLSPFLLKDEMRSGGRSDIVSTHKNRMDKVIKYCDKIICVSKNTAADMQNLFSVPDHKLQVIYEALPIRFESIPDKLQITKIKSKYQLTDYLVTVGTPQPRKNIPRLIDAYKKYGQTLGLPDKLVIIGGNGWGENIYTHDPSIIFTGYLPDMETSALVSGSQALVYTSLYEGFGLPVLLGFHLGVPVITSNTSSLPEIAGDAAVLADPLSVESIAHGIQKALKLRSQLVGRGKEQLKKYSWSKTAQETLQIYKQLC